MAQGMKGQHVPRKPNNWGPRWWKESTYSSSSPLASTCALSKAQSLESSGAHEVVQWVKGSAAKPDDLSSIPRNPVVEGEG